MNKIKIAREKTNYFIYKKFIIDRIPLDAKKSKHSKKAKFKKEDLKKIILFIFKFLLISFIYSLLIVLMPMGLCIAEIILTILKIENLNFLYLYVFPIVLIVWCSICSVLRIIFIFRKTNPIISNLEKIVPFLLFTLNLVSSIVLIYAKYFIPGIIYFAIGSSLSFIVAKWENKRRKNFDEISLNFKLNEIVNKFHPASVMCAKARLELIIKFDQYLSFDKEFKNTLKAEKKLLNQFLKE